jgi:hypothetical protein
MIGFAPPSTSAPPPRAQVWGASPNIPSPLRGTAMSSGAADAENLKSDPRCVISDDRPRHTWRHPAANCYPAQVAASEATVTSMIDEDRAQAIRFSDCSRSSTAWKAAAWAFEA